MEGVGMNFWTSGFGVSLMEMKRERMKEEVLKWGVTRCNGLIDYSNCMSLYFTLRIAFVKDESIAVSSSQFVTEIGTISAIACSLISSIPLGVRFVWWVYRKHTRNYCRDRSFDRAICNLSSLVRFVSIALVGLFLGTARSFVNAAFTRSSCCAEAA